MSNEKLTPWPDKDAMYAAMRPFVVDQDLDLDIANTITLVAYERALASAAMERLNLAVDALRDTAKAGYVAAQYMGLDPRPSHQKQVSDALLKAGRVLAAIDMPKERT